LFCVYKKLIKLPAHYFLPASFGLGAFIVVLSLIFYNYIIDPYGIFKNDFSNQKTEPNQYYIKTKRLIDYPNRYTTLIFGSSRISHIDLQSFFGDEAYNMSYSQGIPHNHLSILTNVIERQKRLKHVFIGLDEYDYTVDPIEQQNHLLRRAHFSISGEPPTNFYSSYLIRKPSIVDQQLFLYFFEELTGSPFGITFDILKTGRCFLPKYDMYIEKNIEAHVARKSFDRGGMFPGPYGIHRLMKDIEGLIKLSNIYGFKLTFFINPMHYSVIKHIDLISFYTFKYELAKLTPFYDFSMICEPVKNNRNFYDPLHYRTNIGYQIAKTLFNDNQSRFNTPSSFEGKYIDDSNINSHIKEEINILRKLPDLKDKLCDIFQLKAIETSLPLADNLYQDNFNNIISTRLCAIDAIDGASIKDNEYKADGHNDISLLIKGWFGNEIILKELGKGGLHLGLISKSDSKTQFFYKLHQYPQKPNISSHSGLSNGMNLGFYGQVKISAIPKGKYSVFVGYDGENECVRYNSPVTLMLN